MQQFQKNCLYLVSRNSGENLRNIVYFTGRPSTNRLLLSSQNSPSSYNVVRTVSTTRYDDKLEEKFKKRLPLYNHHRLLLLPYRNFYDVNSRNNAVRSISFTSSRFDDKVEQTLKRLREELEIKEQENKMIQQAQDSAAQLKKLPLHQRVWSELKHYYHGFKLFFIDARVSSRLVWQLMKGNQLSRLEKRQLIRTAADLFRLVPFLVFIIVPFMEFLLPFYLKFFPGALPSTFQEVSKEAEKARKQLKVRLEMAKFLNATLEEIALERKTAEGSPGSKVAEFSDFLKKIREGVGYVSNTELLKYSKLFEDELTLDNLSVAQLRALCRIVGIKPIGTANILRFQLDMKLRELKADDKLIAKEGVDNLSIWELQAACRARGMRALGLSEDRLKQQLGQWLELSLNEKVPPSLLLLSSTLYLPEEVSFADRLKTILTTLPTHTAEEIKLKMTELEGGKVDNKAKMQIIQSIEASLKKQREEEEHAKKLEEERAQRLEEDIAKKVVEAAQTADAPMSAIKKVLRAEPDLDMADPTEIKEALKPLVKQKVIDSKELDQIEDLLLETTKPALHEEKEDLEKIKQDIKEHKEDLEQVQAIVISKGEKVSESKAAQRLEASVNRMISQMDHVVAKLQEQKATMKEEIAEGGRKEEIKKDMISINDLMLSVRRLQKLPDDTKLQRVVDVLTALDEDKDGAINVDLALKVIDLLGQDNVKISADQMHAILELLKKEDLVEKEKDNLATAQNKTTDAAKSASESNENQDQSKRNAREKIAQ